MDMSGNINEKIIKISVFDFDGTLISTELPETGKIKYKEKTGLDWPHIGWWGKPESLDVNIFDNELIEETFNFYKREFQRENTLCIMMTGRRTVLSKEVELILEKHNLKFHRYYYNTGGETFSCKIKTLDKLLEEFPHVEEVELFEDRPEHVEMFESWGKIIGAEVKVNHIKQGSNEIFAR
jgi:hypothetical protein